MMTTLQSTLYTLIRVLATSNLLHQTMKIIFKIGFNLIKFIQSLQLWLSLHVRHFQFQFALIIKLMAWIRIIMDETVVNRAEEGGGKVPRTGLEPGTPQLWSGVLTNCSPCKKSLLTTLFPPTDKDLGYLSLALQALPDWFYSIPRLAYITSAWFSLIIRLMQQPISVEQTRRYKMHINDSTLKLIVDTLKVPVGMHWSTDWGCLMQHYLWICLFFSANKPQLPLTALPSTARHWL
jgi:hypothetical protein